MPPPPPAFALVWTESFARTARRFLRKRPDLDGILADVLRQLETDPKAPRLRLHALHGRHRGTQAISLTYECRIVLIVRFTPKEVVLLDIGSHDEVYRE